ncbi:MAG: aconitase X catalytic domain-containing protein, partial [Clostridiales bacterium]|nr:aconitase X catalytic domain-containing protein [Clostridiales bacterium]
KDKAAKPKLAFIGCPHLSVDQLNDWTEKIVSRLAKNGKEKVAISLVLTAAPKVLDKFKGSENAKKLEKAGVVISYICPLMYMNNPLCGKMPVITNSNKLRTYTSAKYMTDEEILSAVAGEALA